MARKVHRLSARKAETLTTPGMHGDGGGLYLRITAGKKAGKRWVFLYRRPGDGKRCELGLGGTKVVSLAKARQKAAEARNKVVDGRDPKAEKDAVDRMPTFGDLADQHIAAMAPSWRNQKHRSQWETTLREYAKPLRYMPVDTITTANVLAVLRPIWQTIPETASRVRGRIENVLDAAKVQGFRDGQNPAAWRGHLKLILPARQKLTRGHHAAMAIDAVPGFVASLRTRSPSGVSPKNRVPRSTIRTPSCSSMLLRFEERAGCVIPQACAARPKCFSRASASRSSSLSIIEQLGRALRLGQCIGTSAIVPRTLEIWKPSYVLWDIARSKPLQAQTCRQAEKSLYLRSISMPHGAYPAAPPSRRSVSPSDVHRQCLEGPFRLGRSIVGFPNWFVRIDEVRPPLQPRDSLISTKDTGWRRSCDLAESSVLRTARLLEVQFDDLQQHELPLRRRLVLPVASAILPARVRCERAVISELAYE